jgi:hypothetical protein
MASIRANPKDMVQLPAIALLVTGCLYALGGLGFCGLGAYGFTATPPLPSGPNAEMMAEYRSAYQRSAAMYSSSGLFALVVSALIIFGAWQMRNLKSYGLALTSSILAMIPCHLCCMVGLPIGIWALIVLLKTEVKSAFS